jgi:hypothetical protein
MMIEEVISGGVNNEESGFFRRSREQMSGGTVRSHQNLIGRMKKIRRTWIASLSS